jgi:hypothetical protein
VLDISSVPFPSSSVQQSEIWSLFDVGRRRRDFSNRVCLPPSSSSAPVAGALPPACAQLTTQQLHLAVRLSRPPRWTRFQESCFASEIRSVRLTTSATTRSVSPELTAHATARNDCAGRDGGPRRAGSKSSKAVLSFRVDQPRPRSVNSRFALALGTDWHERRRGMDLLRREVLGLREGKGRSAAAALTFLDIGAPGWSG